MTTTATPQIPQITAAEAANAAIEEAVEFARGYGHVSDIAKALREATGQPVSRSMVSRWLNEDPTKREQPRLGTGLMLLYVVAALKTGKIPKTLTLTLTTTAK